MPTKRKRWPNECYWALLDSLDETETGIAALMKTLDQTDDAETLRQITKAINAFRVIEKKLSACRTERNEQS